jgi:hypothetical protein
MLLTEAETDYTAVDMAGFINNRNVKQTFFKKKVSSTTVVWRAENSS